MVMKLKFKIKRFLKEIGYYNIMATAYRLKKETPELKEDTIVIEDIKQDNYYAPDTSYYKVDDIIRCVFSRKSVENQPDWWESVEPVFLTKNELKKLQNQLND